jgi:hypothetical protein
MASAMVDERAKKEAEAREERERLRRVSSRSIPHWSPYDRVRVVNAVP